jgi:hypothetical protein
MEILRILFIKNSLKLIDELFQLANKHGLPVLKSRAVFLLAVGRFARYFDVPR